MADENKSIREQIKKDNEFNLKLAQQEASVQRDLAKILSEEGESQKALEVLDMVKDSLGSGALSSLYKTQKLSLYLDTENYDAAVKLADEMIAKKDESFAHPLAYLKKAIAVEKKGDIEEAKAIYKKLSSDYPEHSAGKTAMQYLRIL